MNLFTQTVDSALWSSRAYDDAEYDTPRVTSPPSLPSISGDATLPPSTTLIIATGSCAALLSSSYFAAPPPALGQVGPSALHRVSGSAVSLCAGGVVDAADARAWARTVVCALRPARVAVLGDARGDAGLVALGAAAGGVRAAPMRPPALMDGLAAACVDEALLAGVAACGYVWQGDGAVGAEALDAFAEVVDCEGAVAVGEAEKRERLARFVGGVKRARAASGAQGLYT